MYIYITLCIYILCILNYIHIILYLNEIISILYDIYKLCILKYIHIIFYLY